MAAEVTRRSYSQQDIENALQVYWLEGNNARRAGQQLDIPPSTIREWVKGHQDTLERLQEEKGQMMRDALLSRNVANQVKALEVIQHGLDQTLEQLETGQAKDPGKLAHQAAVTYALLYDKAAHARGEPTVRVENTDAAEHLRRIAARFPWLVIDSTAEEEPAELPPN